MFGGATGLVPPVAGGGAGADGSVSTGGDDGAGPAGVLLLAPGSENCGGAVDTTEESELEDEVPADDDESVSELPLDFPSPDPAPSDWNILNSLPMTWTI